MPTTQTAILGGYRITRYAEIPSRNGVAFTGVLTRDGVAVLQVSNEGRGGCHQYDPVGDDFGAARQARKDLDAFAATWTDAPIEAADTFVWHLIEVAALSRKRKVVYLLDDDDYFGAGTHHEASGDRAAIIEALRTRYGARNPRVWDKDACAFISLT